MANREVRRAAFETRANVPISAAVLVANGVREYLAALLHTAVDLRLFEPCVPDASAWEAILRDAECFGFSGPLGDAALIFRRPDAQAVVAVAFGEEALASPLQPLSSIEREVLLRVARALAPALQPVCGSRDPALLGVAASATRYMAYVELAIETPFAARIGLALARDPLPPITGALERDGLAELPVELCIALELGVQTARELLDLDVGDILAWSGQTRVEVEGQTLALGECGVRAGHYCLTLTQPLGIW